MGLLVAGPAFSKVEDGVLLVIDDPLLLRELEIRGFSASERIEGEKLQASDLKSWTGKSFYNSIRTRLVDDLAVVKSGDRALGVTMGSGHRLFNGEWLSSPDARFDLVGVVNRLDRASFYPATEPGACGEVRFIYRLSYTRKLKNAAGFDETVYTRLPMTLNVVYWAPGPDCPRTAKSWLRAGEPRVADLDSLMVGPLRPELYPISRLKSVEVNLQSVRWPSSIRPDLGGHAEYIMRVFHREGRKFIPAVMENTPDLARTGMAQELKSYLRRADVQKAYDQGIAVLPDRFLAEKATSAAFYGQSRQANRPFEKFISEKDLRDLVFDGARFVKSPAGYLRRMNEMSCMGCHQGRSIAGFHFVGIDAPGTHPANAIKVSHSAHLLRDLPRRAAFVKAVASGTGAEPARPFAERDVTAGEGGYGDHCGLGQDPTFKAWTCNAGLECRLESGPAGGSSVGVCLPPKNNPKLARSGDPCDAGKMTQNFNAHKDRLIDKKIESCGDHRGCFAAGEGFPGGLCFGECDNLESGEACGLIAGNGFNECLFQGKLFTDCLKNFTIPISLRARDEETPCRDDYICTGTAEKKGTCIPPYFLFQLRLDGHVKPVSSTAPARPTRQ